MTQDEKDYEEFINAQKALRDILYLFKVLIEYGGLEDDLSYWEYGDFDPLYYIDWNKLPDDIFGMDLSILHTGSAVLLICDVLQAWGQGGYPEKESPHIYKIKQLLKDRRLDHIPELRDALSIALTSEYGEDIPGQHLYNTYVLKTFKALGDDGTT